MKRISSSRNSLIEALLATAVLIILLVYTYARFFVEPNAGFDFDMNGYVVRVYVQGNLEEPLAVGDRLVRVGSVSWEDFQSDYNVTLFQGAQRGQVVPMLIDRNGTQIPIPWTYPGPSAAQNANRALSAFWLGYFFWLMGLLVSLHLRPRGEARNLAMAFCYLIAIGAVVGNPATYHVWGSAILLRMSIWFGVPVFLGFNWLWPVPFRRPSIWFSNAAYLLAGVLAIAEFFQLLPHDAFFLGFLTSIGGTILLLVAHVVLQPASRRGLRWVFVVLIVAFIPLLGYPVFGTRLAPQLSSSLPSVGLPFIPLAYFSSIMRRQFGEMELRVNRVVTSYAFLVVLGLLLLPWIAILSMSVSGPGSNLVVGAVVGIVSALVSILWFPAFRQLMERHVLGAPVPVERLVATYAARVAQCNSLSDLAALFTHTILPSLLIRQFVFLTFIDQETDWLVSVGLKESQIPEGRLVRQQLSAGRTGAQADASARAAFGPEFRLAMPLRIRDELVGAWLLGHRDPDDLYPAADVAVIQSLADQTAVALSNIYQTQRLRELYQANVNRDEEERMRLALKLHDSILNRLAALLMKLDGPSITPAFQSAYEELSNLVRGIVADLRPPMLVYGLKPAIEELVEDRMAESSGTPQISVVIDSDDVRYAPLVELHLYRIVQQSLENAIEHAQATGIWISGHLNPREAEIRIRDDGTGFAAPDGAALQNLIAHKHFGLAGLIERANLIGARVQIESAPGTGTRVQVNWPARAD